MNKKTKRFINIDGELVEGVETINFKGQLRRKPRSYNIYSVGGL